jgi:hypothetical protein
MSITTFVRGTIGYTCVLLCYYPALIAFYLLFTGSWVTRGVIGLLYLYQITICKTNQTIKRFFADLHPFNFFQDSKLILEEEKLPTQKALFGFHPHGILAAPLGFNTLRHPVLYNTHPLASRALLFLPLSGLFSRWMGIKPVDRGNFLRHLQNGDNVSLSPGGFEEATLSDNNQDLVFIKNRKGFIKYALEFGYTIFPCYTFGENKSYYSFTGLQSFRLFLNKIKMPGTVFIGKYGIFPRRDIGWHTVIGKGIQCPRIEHPAHEDVEKFHKLYIEELERIFEKYREELGGSKTLKVR